MTSERGCTGLPPGGRRRGLTQTEQQRGDAAAGGEARFHPGALCGAAGGAAGRELTGGERGVARLRLERGGETGGPPVCHVPLTLVCPAVELACPTTRLL